MIRWTKLKAIATFEFLAAVKRPGYLIATFGMPVFMGIYSAIVALPAYYAQKAENKASIYGLVDRSGVVSLSGDAEPTLDRLPPGLQRALEAAGQRAAMARALADEHFIFRPFASEESARQALADRGIKGYFVLPDDYMTTGTIDTYQAEGVSLTSGDARRALASLLRERLVGGHVEGTTAARILTPVLESRAFAVTPSGEIRDAGRAASTVRIVVPIAFMILFLMSVLMTSGYLIQGTATEKENKVVEVLLASANPDEILGGKLVGLGGAGLLQIAVWLSILTIGGLGVVPLLLSSKVEFPWIALALALPLFLLGFLFFGSLMLGTGSLGSNMRESQQLAMAWSLTAALPMMMMALLIREPHGIVARVMTWLPMTAAPLVMLRASLDLPYLAWWEIAGVFVVLAVSSWIALRIGGRLFRIGLLSSGSRPSLREIIRQAQL
ncbi:MAG: ABC transporter permease [Vicinamibacterales bacterium]